MKRIYPLIVLITLVLLSACAPALPTESALATPAVPAKVTVQQATASPLSTATSRPAATRPPLEITVGPTPATSVAGPATATPASGQTFPIWWTVHPETMADGRTVFRVDQPEVKDAVSAQYHEILAFYSNQDGPVDLDRAPYYSVDKEAPLREASRATAVAQGWYWRIPVPKTLNWEGKPEFSANGSEVTWTFVVTDEQITAEDLYSRQVSLDTGEVMQEVRLPALRQTVFLQYDPSQGRWRLDDANSHMELQPTSTPEN